MKKIIRVHHTCSASACRLWRPRPGALLLARGRSRVDLEPISITESDITDLIESSLKAKPSGSCLFSTPAHSIDVNILNKGQSANAGDWQIWRERPIEESRMSCTTVQYLADAFEDEENVWDLTTKHEERAVEEDGPAGSQRADRLVLLELRANGGAVRLTPRLMARLDEGSWGWRSLRLPRQSRVDRSPPRSGSQQLSASP